MLSVGLFTVPMAPLAWRCSVARFEPSAAASARARLAVAAQLGQPAVFPRREVVALAVSIAMSATALRFARPAPSLPVWPVDPVAARVARDEGGTVDPSTGKSVIVLEPSGTILGESDAVSVRAQRAAANALRILASLSPTTLPTVEIAGPPIESGGSAELGIAPAVVAGIVAASVLVVGGAYAIGRYTSSERAAMDAKQAIEIHDADTASQLAIKRMRLEAATGTKIEPSPIEIAAAKRIEGGASKESTRGWAYFGVGTAIGAGAVVGAPHVARRLGLGAR